MTSTSPATTERRENHQVREVFERACGLLAPIVAGNDNVKTVSNFAMAHMVEEHFPELSSAQVHIVIETVEKMHREDRINAILNKKG